MTSSKHLKKVKIVFERNLISLTIAVVHLRQKHFEKSSGSTPVFVVRFRVRFGNGPLELAEEPEVGDDPLATD